MNQLQTVSELPAWRRVAASSWGMSDDPAIYGWLDIDATNMLAYIERLRASSGTHVTVTHLVGKAVAMAFAAHPESNALVSLGRVRRRSSVDVFFSVAIGDGKNLSGAKIVSADQCSVVDIANKLNKGVARIRGKGDTKLQRSQQMLRSVPSLLLKPLMRATASAMFDWDLDLGWAGVPYDPFGTVIITNVGVLGIEQGFAPLMPQGRTSALFTVGKIRDKVMAVDGKPAVRPVITLGATFDHRVVDGYHLGRISEMLHEVLGDPALHLDGEIAHDHCARSIASLNN
jgi:pyruvate/2-oxoglutarate dehydrogenase complex dihydrolipoamide acyltransferase (E2) component